MAIDEDLINSKFHPSLSPHLLANITAVPPQNLICSLAHFLPQPRASIGLMHQGVTLKERNPAIKFTTCRISRTPKIMHFIDNKDHKGAR